MANVQRNVNEQLWLKNGRRKVGDRLLACAFSILAVASVFSRPVLAESVRPLWRANHQRAADNTSEQALANFPDADRPTSDLPTVQLSEPILLTGEFSDFVPVSNYFVTYVREDETSRLHDETGTEVAILAGRLSEISDDGSLLVTHTLSEDEQYYIAHVYDARTGEEIVSIEGVFKQFVLDGSYFAVLLEDNNSRNNDRLAFYDRRGNETARVEGSFYNWVFPTNEESDLLMITTVANGESTDQTNAATADPTVRSTAAYDLLGQKMFEVQGSLVNGSVGTTQFATVAERESHHSERNDDAFTRGYFTTLDRESFIYDMTGNEIMTLPGEVFIWRYGENGEFSTLYGTEKFANGRDFISYLYDGDGNRTAALDGKLVAISPDGERFITTTANENLYDWADDISYLYDAEGNLLASFSGQGGFFSDDSTRFVVWNLAEISATGVPVTSLYNANGEAIGTLPGGFVGFSPDSNYLALYDQGETRIYDGDGNETATLAGVLEAINADGTLLISEGVDSDGIAYGVHLYDGAGNEMAKLPGFFSLMTEDESRFVTYTFEDNTARLFLLSDFE